MVKSIFSIIFWVSSQKKKLRAEFIELATVDLKTCAKVKLKIKKTFQVISKSVGQRAEEKIQPKASFLKLNGAIAQRKILKHFCKFD